MISSAGMNKCAGLGGLNAVRDTPTHNNRSATQSFKPYKF